MSCNHSIQVQVDGGTGNFFSNRSVPGSEMPFMIEGASGRWPQDTGRAKET
jgi:hypothetical protein